MRIIAGEFRGRPLLAPAGLTTRPITDRVKQSVFDILAPWLEGARVYDCFAGTGSLGLECLSRGAAWVTFFEADRSALDLLASNIAALGVAKRCKVVGGDIFRPFGEEGMADLIFLDPPYRFLHEEAEGLRRLTADLAQRATAESRLIFRRAAGNTLELGSWKTYDQRDYGSMVVEVMGRSQKSEIRSQK